MQNADADRAAQLQILRSSLSIGALTGCTGIVIGSVGGVLRSSHPILFSVVSGAQWFTLGSTFWFSRTFLLRELGQDHSRLPFVSAVAGSLSATATAALFRGRANMLPGAVVGGALGFAGQHGVNAWNTAPDEDAPASRPLLERITKSRWFPLKHLSDDEYRELIEKKLLRVEAELAIIDEDMDSLRKSQTAEQPEAEQ